MAIHADPAAQLPAPAIFDSTATSPQTEAAPACCPTPAAVANSHNAFLTLHAMPDKHDGLHTAAGAVLCYFEDAHLTVAQLADLLHRRTHYTMIYEVFEYEFAGRVIATYAQLTDVAETALFLFTGIKPEEPGTYARDAAAARQAAYAALYL